MQVLSLGTAQWGNPYGVTNTEGYLSDERISELAQTALDLDIKAVDTAAAYGSAQERLRPWASAFAVTTKISGSSTESVEIQVNAGLEAMGLAGVHAVLVHDWPNLNHDQQATVGRELSALKDLGLISRIGVSAYERVDIERALEIFDTLGCVQVPISILDQRLIDKNDVIDALVNLDIEVQARSVFLQGLLAGPSPVKLAQHPDIMRFHADCATHHIDPIVLALAFIKSQEWISTVVVGVTSVKELTEIHQAWEVNPQQRQGLKTLDFGKYASLDIGLIDPRMWGNS